MIVRKAVFNRFLKRLSQTERFPVDDLARERMESTSENSTVSTTAVSDLEQGVGETELTVDKGSKDA